MHNKLQLELSACSCIVPEIGKEGDMHGGVMSRMMHRGIGMGLSALAILLIVACGVGNPGSIAPPLTAATKRTATAIPTNTATQRSAATPPVIAGVPATARSTPPVNPPVPIFACVTRTSDTPLTPMEIADYPSPALYPGAKAVTIIYSGANSNCDRRRATKIIYFEAPDPAGTVLDWYHQALTEQRWLHCFTHSGELRTYLRNAPACQGGTRTEVATVYIVPGAGVRVEVTHRLPPPLTWPPA